MGHSARSRSANTSSTSSTTATPPWRRLAASLVALALFSLLSLSLAHAADAQPRAAGAAGDTKPKVYQPSGKGTAIAHGVVDMAKLPVLQPHAVTTAQQSPLPPLDALTPAQRAAYNDKMRKAGPATVTPGATNATPSGATPKFVGGGNVPLLVKQYEGLNSTQAGGGTGNIAVATDLSYLMQGVDNAIAIYRTTTGALAYGPYSPDTFFTAVKHQGSIFSNPQMYYDTMRDRWIVLYLEFDPVIFVTYLDLAVSQSTSPTQPTPGAQYNVYQFATNFDNANPTYCGSETLGVDYYGIYITCANFLKGGDSFLGNTVLAINKAPLLTGAPNPITYWWNDALRRVDNIGNDLGPALALSPALEEGVQDGEFIVSTDAGFGLSSTNLSVCALTNQSNMATTQPTFSCVHHLLPFPYQDPFLVGQPGGQTISIGFGTKQVYYKAGRLFLAWTSLTPDGLSDFIYWAEVRPVLSNNPLTLVSVEATPQPTVPPPGVGYFTPSIVGTDEEDVVLVFNRSGSLYPGIAYTGRKATDPYFFGVPNTLTPSNFGGVINGTHATSTTWGKYSACAISLNSVTRGTIWCAAEYTGATADPGWNTRLVNLRAE
jgi:hypothetical protein